MSAITHIPFYPSDWLAGTRGMTAAEMGVYITILAMIYERAGPIKADDMAKLARLCGTSASALKGILESLIADEKLTLVDGHLSNRRAELEIKNVMAKSEVAKANINARWEKRQAKSTTAEYGGNTGEILATSQELKKKDKAKALSKKGTRLPDDWHPIGQDWDMADSLLGEIGAANELIKFQDYWRSVPGQKGVKLDWPATWRNWVRTAAGRKAKSHSPPWQNRKPNYVDALNEILSEANHERPQGQIHNRDAERMAVLDWRPETSPDDVPSGGGGI
jgi:uncharacterized protein YdaU (DUF1376 family)